MQDDKKLDALCDLFIRLTNEYKRFEKECHCFDVDSPLHLSDTHTIVAIGKNTNINIMQLSKLQGISRSAVSQMISKLVQRGFVKKTRSTKTENEVVLTLTEKGQRVYYLHEQQHEQLLYSIN